MALKSTTSLEWFGATTFRLKANGLVLFLDTWLEKPSVLKQYLAIEEVDKADYILISHAHFDQLAKRTGAIVIGNCEAINVLRTAGVPEQQLIAVAGGEKVPLFTKDALEKAARGEIERRPAPPAAPPIPSPSYAVMSVDVWPSLHCLMPPVSHADMPEVMDTGTTYTGAAHPYVCTFDINHGMRHGLLQVDKTIPREYRSEGMQSFIEYISDREKNAFSAHDGGQLMYNVRISDRKTILWNAHLGAYEGLLHTLEPKPEIAILGIAGRANANGRPYDGSAAEFARQEAKLLNEPKQIIWCLHDESPIPPYRIDTRAATELVEKDTKSRILDLEHNKAIYLDL